MKKTDIAKKVFAANPKVREVFVCDNGNSFHAESRALAHARENEVKFLGGITRGELKDELTKEAVNTVETTMEALDNAKTIAEAKDKANQKAKDEFAKTVKKGKELDELAKKADESLAKAIEAKKVADSKAKTTNTDTDKDLTVKAKTALEKAQQVKGETAKAALNQTTVEINKAEVLADNTKKELETANKQVEKLEIALTEAEQVLDNL